MLVSEGKMAEDNQNKKCPEYCPFLKAQNTFCELFRKSLQNSFGVPLKCEQCLNPEQRMESYQSLGLSLDSRINMWQKAVLKHNEIELGKKREEEALRKRFAAFLEDKFGARPPLEGNTYLNNLLINLYMVLDGTERSMMMSVLNSGHGIELVQAVDRTPKDENLLRNFRRELDAQYVEYHNGLERGMGMEHGR